MSVSPRGRVGNKGGGGNGISVNNDEHSQINHEDPGQLAEGVGEGGGTFFKYLGFLCSVYISDWWIESMVHGMNKASLKKYFQEVLQLEN